VSQDDITALLLLALQGLALALGLMILGAMLALHRRHRLAVENLYPPQKISPRTTVSLLRPDCWLAIRAVSPEAVQIALGLNRAQPCSWAEGLAGKHEFFISPRVNGWVIVTGMGLPDPTDDVDATFIFLTALSKQLGHVQYFYASRLFHHHGWARLDDGCVTRAYAWTGETVWQQGVETLPEIEADVKLFAYADHTATILDAEMNFEKVPRLAARWSLDPAKIKLSTFRPALGIAGESAFG
jgi:hypothetical protein